MSFDTIRFKLHNLADLQDFSINLVSGKNVVRGRMEFVSFDAEFNETKEEEMIKAKLTSGSYDINYSLNYTENTVLFEFSIPKYIYGHNLDHYPLSSGNEYNDLLFFLNKFFVDEFGFEVDFKNIELLRLDLCYNYSFESEINKETYKEHASDLFGKVFHDKKVLKFNDNSTVMYKTQDYSFKVYDKGLEFEKNDLKKITKYFGIKKANELMQRAKLITRSEITFRKRKISYDFFSKISTSDQVSEHFKKRFGSLKDVYQDVQMMNEKLTVCLNRYNGTLQHIDDALFPILITAKYKKHYSSSIGYAKKTYVERRTKKMNYVYKNSDFNCLVVKSSDIQIKEYLHIISPKRIFLDLTDFVKKSMLYTYPSVIHFNENVLGNCLAKFKEIITDINFMKNNVVSPLLGIFNNEELIKSLGINPNTLRGYVNDRKTMSAREIYSRKLRSRETVYRLERQIKQINDILEKQGKATISTLKLPEKITFK
jgi:hypothetical protein